MKVSKGFTDREIYLEKQTYHAFKQMREAALRDSIKLKIISGARSFYHQRDIWEWKWERNRLENNIKKALDILEYSSMPGTSRHHWGTDIDINSLNNKYFDSGEGLKEFEWLSNNAYKFGFCNVLSSKGETNRTGYEEEKWHWSYLPVSAYFLRYYPYFVSNEDISGFKGAELAKELEVIDQFVFGVNECN
ncbi:MAG: M15 family metallopeptidase [Bacteroidales bacterium]